MHRRDNTNVNNYATSTIHKYLNETYYNTLPQQDREKLRTKAVWEEFHGDTTGKRKLLYGWNTLTANVWLPSLSELVGIDPDHYDDGRGCYNSAMQGLNTSTDWFTDAQGGTQFAYFQQFNASGGGGAIWNACNQEWSWLRSTARDVSTSVWFPNGTQRFDWMTAITSLAVHPAVLYNPERLIKQTVDLLWISLIRDK